VNLLLCQHNTNSWGTMLISYFRTQTIIKQPIAWETIARVIFLAYSGYFQISDEIPSAANIEVLWTNGIYFDQDRCLYYKGYRNRT